jgi:6-pyruvoyl-tetrahydropterin synthase
LNYVICADPLAPAGMSVILVRRETFSAAHSLRRQACSLIFYETCCFVRFFFFMICLLCAPGLNGGSTTLSDDENKRIFGPCFGIHGHNYVCEWKVQIMFYPKILYAAQAHHR